MIRVPVAAAAVLGATLLLAACGSAAVAKSDVEGKVKAQLTENDVKTSSVDCPKDLPAKKGSKVNCDVQVKDGEKVGVDVTVTSVKDGNVKFDIELDEKSAREAQKGVDETVDNVVAELDGGEGAGADTDTQGGEGDNGDEGDGSDGGSSDEEYTDTGPTDEG